jgi:hypothetical protein
VYGYLLCPRTCRVLVQEDDGVFNLPGGTPEPEDGGARFALCLGALSAESDGLDSGVCAVVMAREGPAGHQPPGLASGRQVRFVMGGPGRCHQDW